MSKIQVFVTLLALFLLVSSSNIPQRRQRQIKPLYEGQYLFEGVDYDLMLDTVRIEHYDCYGHHLRCIRRKTYFTPVCGYNYKSGYYEDYYSPCEIELFSCKYRVENGMGGVYGNSYNQDILFYNGEELNCLYYYRRSRNSLEMDMLYTGSKNPPYRSLPRPEMYMRGIDEKNFSRTKDIRGFDGNNLLGLYKPDTRGSIGKYFRGSNESTTFGSNETNSDSNA